MTVSPSSADDLAGRGDGPPPGLHAMEVADFFDGSPVATFVIDAQHVVTHFNRACALTLEVEARDVIGKKNMGKILYGRDRPVLADLVVDGALEALETLYHGRYGKSDSIAGAFHAEAFFPRLGEAGRWLTFTAAPLRDSNGEIVGAIETLQDISDRKRIEVALRATQDALNDKLATAYDQLVQSEKLASIGQLAAGVAHEINNPIGYISSNFGSLEKYLASVFEMLAAYEAAEATHGDAHTKKHLQAVRERLDIGFLKEDIPHLMRESREGFARVRKIVQDLKDFSHVGTSTQWDLVDLAHCIDSTVNVVNNEIKYRADVVKSLGALPLVQCHASEINQVIMNLVVNAAQAIEQPRGTITISAGCEGERAWFAVSDTGSGISKESLARIFDPFYTTKPVGKGTGLGLSISYGIVQKHHGHIDVSTEVGNGTTFKVYLPIKQADVAAST